MSPSLLPSLLVLGITLVIAAVVITWLYVQMGHATLQDSRSPVPRGIDPWAVDEQEEDPKPILAAIASLKSAEEYATRNHASRVNVHPHVRRTGSTAHSALRRVR